MKLLIFWVQWVWVSLKLKSRRFTAKKSVLICNWGLKMSPLTHKLTWKLHWVKNRLCKILEEGQLLVQSGLLFQNRQTINRFDLQRQGPTRLGTLYRSQSGSSLGRAHPTVTTRATGKPRQSFKRSCQGDSQFNEENETHTTKQSNKMQLLALLKQIEGEKIFQCPVIYCTFWCKRAVFSTEP